MLRALIASIEKQKERVIGQTSRFTQSSRPAQDTDNPKRATSSPNTGVFITLERATPQPVIDSHRKPTVREGDLVKKKSLNG
ncbi:uncharacterized protein FRV6_13623 [Fusarium oxysporum]|uniref:Uncharacterized protein n=1 Tax=Fusarium oxysporum TaxID=5507 RepID=A0A2H3TP86_FUSOX|nr:uncharacterized protein FRV6_13623 [Fusarium oxysporum]